MMSSRCKQATVYSLTVLSFALLVLVALAPISQGQTMARAAIAVRINVPPIVLIEANPVDVVFTEGQITAGEQADGTFVVEKRQAMTLTTTGNVPYSLLISTEADVWTESYGGSIPVSRLEWRAAGHDWTPLSIELRPVLDVVDPERETTRIDLRLTLEFTDAPGTYAGDILFTLQAREG